MKRSFLGAMFWIAGIGLLVSCFGTGCAQIGSPTGGPKDTTAPILVVANPPQFTTQFKGNKIVFTFNEYIDVKEVQNNLVVSPFPKVMPQVDFKLKTVTVKLKDTLQPNTTYALDFGNAIRDNNEGNPYKNLTYVFSTGSQIDSLQLKGRVVLAETGATDSTYLAVLYRKAADSAVSTRRPDYIAKLNGAGYFRFINLAAGTYQLYALKDGDGAKTYNAKTEGFAFLNQSLLITGNTDSIHLMAYVEEKEKKPVTGNQPPPGIGADKSLKFATSLLDFPRQDLNKPFQLRFNRPLKSLDKPKIKLTDTSRNVINSVQVTLDSTSSIVSITAPWAIDESYYLILPKDAFADSAGTMLNKTDTLRFKSKNENDYGSILLRFSGIDLSKHPVLQFIKGIELVKSIVITGSTWEDKQFAPGEYSLRLLFDDNQNGIWDPGNFTLRKQPEVVISLDDKLNIKANWENEREVKL